MQQYYIMWGAQNLLHNLHHTMSIAWWSTDIQTTQNKKEFESGTDQMSENGTEDGAGRQRNGTEDREMEQKMEQADREMEQKTEQADRHALDQTQLPVYTLVWKWPPHSALLFTQAPQQQRGFSCSFSRGVTSSSKHQLTVTLITSVAQDTWHTAYYHFTVHQYSVAQDAWHTAYYHFTVNHQHQFFALNHKHINGETVSNGSPTQWSVEHRQ